ncbi:MAG TPA: serine/threonine-protein kinase, partial [Planctomycetota bacterium]|nr:serine/threonine-protein kinase [Planctomycetota bacterium]
MTDPSKLGPQDESQRQVGGEKPTELPGWQEKRTQPRGYEKYDNLRTLHKASVGMLDIAPGDFNAALNTLECIQEPVNQITMLDQLEIDGKLSGARRVRIEARLENIDVGGIRRLGPYRMLTKIGQGQMGAVYEAEDTTSGRKLAVKVLLKEMRKNRDYVARFKREARISKALRHRCIIRCYASGEEEGFLFFAMELLFGKTLKQQIQGSKLDPITATRYVVDLSDALGYAHKAGIVHRDIKPENLFLSADGTLKILDLGLARPIKGEESAAITLSGQALGTPHYMSPEQTRGVKFIDGRSDIYSLGATYFTLLTGDFPFPGASAMQVMVKHNNDPVRDPRTLAPAVPETIVSVLYKMMAKEPKDRYQTCEEVVEDLKRSLNTLGPAASEEDSPGGRRNDVWIVPVRGR